MNTQTDTTATLITLQGKYVKELRGKQVIVFTQQIGAGTIKLLSVSDNPTDKIVDCPPVKAIGVTVQSAIDSFRREIEVAARGLL